MLVSKPTTHEKNKLIKKKNYYGNYTRKKNEELTPEEHQEKIGSYLAQHPNAIVDKTGAWIAAHASKDMEEEVVKFRKRALTAAESLGDSGFRDRENRGASDSANTNAERAQLARTEADKIAAEALSVYHEVKNL